MISRHSLLKWKGAQRNHQGNDIMKIGDKVNVYLDPFTVSDLEDVGVIKSIPHALGDNDVKGRPIFGCLIKFGSEHTGYWRTVSELVK